MVKLGALPNRDIIDGFKGKVDFYIYKNTAVARKWPRWNKREPHPAEKANQDLFAYINKLAAAYPPYLRKQWVRMAQGTPLTWKDLFVKAYMKGLNYG